jgi:hypothetical protein
VAALAGLGAGTLAVVDSPMSIEEAMASGVEPVERAGARLARLIDLGVLVQARADGRPRALTKSHD